MLERRRAFHETAPFDTRSLLRSYKELQNISLAAFAFHLRVGILSAPQPGQTFQHPDFNQMEEKR